jgi:hypothetical protein
MEPIVGIQGFFGLAEHRRVGILEVLEFGSEMIMIPMALVSKVLQCCDVGLTFSPFSLPVLKQGLQQLHHGIVVVAIRWGHLDIHKIIR